MIHLPGRDDEESEDFEAKSALEALMNAEEIKGKQELLTRISEEIDRKRSILDNISASIGAVSEDMEEDNHKSLDPFFDRLKNDRVEKEFKEFESPEARRKRISRGKLKIVNGVLVTKFT